MDHESARQDDEAKRVERRYRELLRISGDVVWELDADNRYIYISENALLANKWQASDFIGKRPSELGWNAVGDDSWDKVLSKLAARELIANLEFAIEHAEIGRRVFRVTAQPQYDEVGNYAGYLGFSRDVTVDAEEISRSRQRFQDIARSAFDWFWEMDADLRFSYISERVSEVYGVPVEQIIGRRREDLLKSTKDPDALERHLADLEARRPFRDFIYSSVRSDGTPYWTSTSGVPVFSDHGEFQGYRGAAREITANIEAEQRADKAHALLLDAIRYSPEGIMLWDADERFVAGNAGRLGQLPDEVAEILVPGLKFEEFTRRLAYSGFLPDAEGREEDWIAERLQWHRSDEPVTFLQQQANGAWARVTKNHTRDGGVLATHTDITELKQSEEALRAAEVQLIDAIETIDHGFALYDRDDNFVLCNSHYRNSFPAGFEFLERGTKFETIIREAAGQGLYDDAEAFVKNRLARHRNPGTPVEINFAANAPIDSSDARGATLLLTERRTREGGMVCVWTDITEQKRREEALAASERRFSLAFDASPAMSAISRMSDGRFINVNAQWLKNLGFAKAEVIGRTSFELGIWAHPDDRQNLIDTLQREGSIRDLENSRRKKDGTLIDLLTSIEAVDIDGEKHLMFISTDNTERKHMENELRRAKSEAEFASRTKSEFLANMSHELRTPLNAIIGFAEFIERQLHGPVGDDRYVGYLHDIRDSGLHLLNLINDILDVSRVEAGKLVLRESTFDINQLVDSSLILIRDRAREAGVELKSVGGDDMPGFLGDETRIKQVVVNLLSNAIKFTPRSGQVTVSTAVDPDDGGILLTVTDTGIGIAEEDIEAVLRVFGQVDSKLSRTYEGAGLGLPLSKALVELHQGVFSLESAVGRGSTFSVKFPPRRSVMIDYSQS